MKGQIPQNMKQMTSTKKKLSSIPNVIISGKIQIDTTLIKYVKLLPQTLSWIYTPNTSCTGHLENTNKWGEAKT